MPKLPTVTLKELDMPLRDFDAAWASGCMLAVTELGTYRVFAHLDGSVGLDNTQPGTGRNYPVAVRGVECWSVAQTHTPGRGLDGFHDFRVDRRDNRPVTDAMRRAVREDTERVITAFRASEHYAAKRYAAGLHEAEARADELSKLVDEVTKAHLNALNVLQAARSGQVITTQPRYRLDRR